jgi:hypothetical protein
MDVLFWFNLPLEIYTFSETVETLNKILTACNSSSVASNV